MTNRYEPFDRRQRALELHPQALAETLRIDGEATVVNILRCASAVDLKTELLARARDDAHRRDAAASVALQDYGD